MKYLIHISKILISLLLIGGSSILSAQEDFYEDLLNEEVEVENPVYKPVIGGGVGSLVFYGDVKNNYNNPLLGKAAYKVNVSTFLDNQHFYKANFFLLYGVLNGNERSFENTARNLNFETDLIAFGINVNYDFRHLIKGERLVRPFISVGVENIQFNSKSDLMNSNSNFYNYWSDGTIRDVPEGSGMESNIISRDYIYESDLRELDLYGLGNYSQNTFAIPVEAGFDFSLSDRVVLRLGTSLHFTLTDLLDNVTSQNQGGLVIGDNKNDKFGFSYVTLHLDLFSDAETILVEKMFANLEGFDYTMYGDEDNDLVYDGWDECPMTPRGVAVDTLGCPFDTDNDGIYDYKDNEVNSRPGAYVNENGVEITEDEVIARLDQSMAVNREDVDKYILKNVGFSTLNRSNIPIPSKFKPLDEDEDEYISYEEMLRAIDRFFDFESTLTTEEIYELNDFFFQQ